LQGVSEMEHRAGKWRPVTRDRHERISPQVSPLAA
jgi:hypothetical protein